jgi:hypothetical protein
MKRRAMAVAAATLAVWMAGSVLQATTASSGEAVSEMKAGEHDLTGVWQIDASRSDTPRAMRERRPEGALPGSGLWFLPRQFRIGTSDRGLALSDSAGTILQVIMYMPVAEGDGERMPPRFAGTWKKDRLTVLRPGRPGTKLTQTFWLDGANTLVVKTKMHRESGSDFEVKRTYSKTLPS